MHLLQILLVVVGTAFAVEHSEQHVLKTLEHHNEPCHTTDLSVSEKTSFFGILKKCSLRCDFDEHCANSCMRKNKMELTLGCTTCWVGHLSCVSAKCESCFGPQKNPSLCSECRKNNCPIPACAQGTN